MEFYKAIAEEMSDIQADIGLLVLNAGVMTIGRYETMSAKAMQDMLDLNVYQVTGMAKHMVPALAERKKSGLIMVSSVAGSCPVP